MKYSKTKTKPQMTINVVKRHVEPKSLKLIINKEVRISSNGDKFNALCLYDSSGNELRHKKINGFCNTSTLIGNYCRNLINRKVETKQKLIPFVSSTKVDGVYKPNWAEHNVYGLCYQKNKGELLIEEKVGMKAVRDILKLFDIELLKVSDFEYELVNV